MVQCNKIIVEDKMQNTLNCKKYENNKNEKISSKNTKIL